ncbi:hypothetical protein QMK33_22985 [Hymenobacter sp. H14-R3]|uniref:hypothetical protein n=1 Tax=Hymenobacter sp. H14-R3 TaxID=3046308 RepID=UPI0024BB37A1|nr:hypothetical protein [Hymenobacter sp. H14-R3]MDJ0368018.1 hypothetical protein [Hymenobacter sp. H14-R3]
MLRQITSITRQFGRYLVAAPLMLGLTLACATAQAQVVPTSAPAEKPVARNVVYYLDGQKVDFDALSKVNPAEISHVQALNKTQQRQIFGITTVDGTTVVTTKANANSPTVLALNKRISSIVSQVPSTAKHRI